LAQCIDPDDFTNKVGMTRWMSHYEHMVNGFVTGVLVSNEEMAMHAKIAGWKVPIYNVSGLSFDAEEVSSRVPAVKPFDQRTRRVSFASRWDSEKQPHYLMDFIERVKTTDPSITFSILSGKTLNSDDPTALERALQLRDQDKLEILDNLSKNQYYAMLNDTRVLINTSLQDWVSNTLSEADTLGCNVLFPAYRSFPEMFANDCTRLYVPWSHQDMENKLYTLMAEPHGKQGQISKWTSKTIDRILDIMQGTGEQWCRNSLDYRNYLNQTKY
jgi:glycosyltransferase involved in cell wall biosynthesis